MFGAAAALDAGVGLQADELREVGSGHEAEVFIAHQRRNLAEAATRKKDGGRAENEMQVLGVRDDGQEDEQGERVCPPENAGSRAGIADSKARQVGHHQEEDQQRDHSRFIGDFVAEPARPHKKSAHEQTEDPDGAGDGEGCGEIEIEPPDQPLWIEKADAQPDRNMVQRDKGECAETPEDEGVRKAGKGSLADDFGLADYFPEEVPHALADRRQAEIRVFPGFEDALEDRSKSPPEQDDRNPRSMPRGAVSPSARNFAVQQAWQRGGS